MSLPPYSEQAEQHPLPALVTPSDWPVLQHLPSLSQDLDWTLYACPLELAQIPVHLDINPKLAEIVQWSLMLKIPQSSKPQQPTQPSAQKEQTQCDVTTVTPNFEKSCGTTTKLRKDNPAISVSSTECNAVSKRLTKLSHRLFSSSNPSAHSEQGNVLRKKQRHYMASVIGIGKSSELDPSSLIARECMSCFEDFETRETTILPCFHVYCKTCLATLVMTTLQTESAFPPKCCLVDIPPKAIFTVLDRTQRQKYHQKVAEFSVPASRRWYCPNPKCAKWISHTQIHRVLTRTPKCPHCLVQMCVACRGLAHDWRSRCPKDVGLEETLAMAELEGWRRCFRCQAMVERTSGCLHMTCRCGAHFCYACGGKFGRCRCSENDRSNIVQGRRLVQSQANQSEADEIARAIAQVEAFERAEAEGRAQQEREEQEAELARLEELRLQEEENRRLERSSLERQLKAVLQLSIQENYSHLVEVLQELTCTQHQELKDRHFREEQSLIGSLDGDQDVEKKKKELLLKAMKSKIEKQKVSLETRQHSEMQTFIKQQKNEWMHPQDKGVKGTSDLTSVLESSSSQHEHHFPTLISKHKSEFKAFTTGARAELSSLMQSIEAKEQSVTARRIQRALQLAIKIATDRLWFRFVCQRRNELLTAHYGLMVDDLNSGRDPIGLTEETFVQTFRYESLHVEQNSGGRTGKEEFILNPPSRTPTSPALPPPPPPSCRNRADSPPSTISTDSGKITSRNARDSIEVHRVRNARNRIPSSTDLHLTPDSSYDSSTRPNPPASPEIFYPFSTSPIPRNGEEYLAIKTGESSRSQPNSTPSSRPTSQTKSAIPSSPQQTSSILIIPNTGSSRTSSISCYSSADSNSESSPVLCSTQISSRYIPNSHTIRRKPVAQPSQGHPVDDPIAPSRNADGASLEKDDDERSSSPPPNYTVLAPSNLENVSISAAKWD